MGQRIGNIGLLNIMNATEESIKKIDYIENVGTLMYSPNNAHLLTSLSIGNIGESISVEKDYQVTNGMISLDAAFLQAVKEPLSILINGAIIINEDVTADLLKTAEIQIITNGVIYSPPHLKGAVQTKMKKTSGTILTYEGKEPRPEIGKVTINNSYLQSLSGNENIIVNGVLTMDEMLDMDMFAEKLNRIDVNGVVELYEHQNAYFTNKGLVNGSKTIIPNGYKHIKSMRSLDRHSIRRFKSQSIFTKKPIVLEKDITREMYANAFQFIHTTSYIVCHEEIEDLVFESLHNFENEVYIYHENMRFINEEQWGKMDFQMLDDGTTLIVEKELTITADLSIDDCKKIDSIILLGEIHVPNSEVKAVLQKHIKVFNGLIIDDSLTNETVEIRNIGELTL
ncbi:hypothetical protein ACUXCC_003138 [Cytobacillus horneckiae]|uniref:Uncharacterized protein n=1 Tax=Cytobacillus horneckiae TaxID=549687 RepID=A0A2N0ZK84_9BACI|nr:hypothetical protein [Cytobacillus horneckiae]MBN6888215.1 hypothetical protein [Cytobacillus horneckiae]MCM3177071.1 hypothetical protein [Cytobacillus horneckiae]MEC1154770.1 hypothetical protein [Cytobacillus horneckiae]MED2940263.1 hypothetical protein [Cytobacillus horneckiae]PKG29886.1 hypothetical protein CWS20_05780 [Cytobacillus horneckiae]